MFTTYLISFKFCSYHYLFRGLICNINNHWQSILGNCCRSLKCSTKPGMCKVRQFFFSHSKKNSRETIYRVSFTFTLSLSPRSPTPPSGSCVCLTRTFHANMLLSNMRLSCFPDLFCQLACGTYLENIVPKPSPPPPHNQGILRLMAVLCNAVCIPGQVGTGMFPFV